MLNKLSLFDHAYNELKRCGITLEKWPGEYKINFRFGADITARFTEKLEDALLEGHHMAMLLTAKKVPAVRGTRLLTLKAKRRLKILTHNHKARALWLKQHRKADE